MKIVLASVFFLFCFTVDAQQHRFRSTAELADFINKQSVDSSEKIAAAYRWVTTNIRYDASHSWAMNHGSDRRAVIDSAFAKRRGVCENFAAIFADICAHIGFQSVVIEGLTKQYGQIDKQGHSWVAVHVSDDWYLFDPTWDKEAGDNFKYFKQAGNLFIDTHFPFDPMWQMMNHPVQFSDFRTNRKSTVLRSVFHYRDSIARYFTLDSLERFEGKVRRMKHIGYHDNVSNAFYREAKGDLEGEKQERQMRWFNSASVLLNECTLRLNEFIQYRNDQFLPARPDSSLRVMLDGIDEKIRSAIQYFDSVDASDAILVYGTEPAREQTTRIYDAYKRQVAFLQTYLNTAIAERRRVFQSQ